MIFPFVHFASVGASDTSRQETGFPDVDRYITSQMKAARIPGVALAVVQGDQIIYLKGYSAADSSERVVTPQTPFLLASSVKSITVLAVMQFVDYRQIDLDAPVQRYLPWFRVADPEASAQITLRQLLPHTSGLPEDAGNELPVSLNLSEQALEERVQRLNDPNRQEKPFKKQKPRRTAHFTSLSSP